MSAKHTPGPWEIEYDNDTGPDEDYFTEWYHVGPAQVHFHKNDEDVAKANANLISAAPDLLEACKQLIELAEWLGTPPGYSWGDICEPVRLGRAAITKAEGE